MNVVEQFEQDGYTIVPDLIPHAKIDHLVERLERFKRGRRPYWSESIHKSILPGLDDHGFLTESMEQFTHLWFSGGLAQAGNDILLGDEINGVLRQLKPGRDEFVHWLNHMFDRSTGSVDHIDNWYLDTDPAGGSHFRSHCHWQFLCYRQKRTSPTHSRHRAEQLQRGVVFSKLIHSRHELDDVPGCTAGRAMKQPFILSHDQVGMPCIRMKRAEPAPVLAFAFQLHAPLLHHGDDVCRPFDFCEVSFHKSLNSLFPSWRGALVQRLSG